MDRNKQELLLKIVRTWDIDEIPQYRGFRCANCQMYINKSWYHWINSEGFFLPIHLCENKCEEEFRNNKISIDESKLKNININTFGSSYQFDNKTCLRFDAILSNWKVDDKPVLKEFTCDECYLPLEIDETDKMRKGYHVWYKTPDNLKLAELHFHKSCAEKLGI